MDDRPDLAAAWDARYAPTLVFLDASGRRVAQEAGYRSARAVLDVFAQVGIAL
ncbi:MAG: hypothetical protein IJR14_09585 [Synergistaceae bacterium]|nr:hypothetical protein [Synergistaceae bacterium]